MTGPTTSCFEDCNRDTVSTADFEPGRRAAMREVLVGYQRGLAKLHPGDHEDRAWFFERLSDLWICAGPSPIAPAPAPEQEPE